MIYWWLFISLLQIYLREVASVLRACVCFVSEEQLDEGVNGLSTPVFVFCSLAPSGLQTCWWLPPEERPCSACSRLMPDRTEPSAGRHRILWHAHPEQMKPKRRIRSQYSCVKVRIVFTFQQGHWNTKLNVASKLFIQMATIILQLWRVDRI